MLDKDGDGYVQRVEVGEYYNYNKVGKRFLQVTKKKGDGYADGHFWGHERRQ
jgi:hypothetical protein